MKKILLSLIIPVFNVEKYLPKCLSNLISKDMNDVEIILVDDGSTDNSSKICDFFGTKFNFIRVKHITNHGVAYARNVGLNLAQGEWVGWVDSDDTVFPGFINILKNLIYFDRNADIYKFGYQTGKTDDSLILKQRKFDKSKLKKETKENAMNDLPSHVFGNYLWCRIFKKKLFQDLRFPLNNNCEDAYLMVEVLEKAQNFYFYNDKLYYHFYHKNTLTTSNNKIKKCLQLKDWLDSNIRLTKKLKKFGYIKAYNYSKTQLLFISYTIVKKVKFEKLPDTELYFRADKILYNYKKYIKNKISFKWNIIFFLRRYFNPIYNMIIYIYYK